MLWVPLNTGMSAAQCQGNVKEFQSVWRVVTLRQHLSSLEDYWKTFFACNVFCPVLFAEVVQKSHARNSSYRWSLPVGCFSYRDGFLCIMCMDFLDSCHLVFSGLDFLCIYDSCRTVSTSTVDCLKDASHKWSYQVICRLANSQPVHSLVALTSVWLVVEKSVLTLRVFAAQAMSITSAYLPVCEQFISTAGIHFNHLVCTCVRWRAKLCTLYSCRFVQIVYC